MWQVAGENFIRRMFFTRFIGGWAQAREALWTRVWCYLVEILADLKSAALDLPIGRATDAICWTRWRVGQNAWRRARLVAAREGENGRVFFTRGNSCTLRICFWTYCSKTTKRLKRTPNSDYRHKKEHRKIAGRTPKICRKDTRKNPAGHRSVALIPCWDLCMNLRKENSGSMREKRDRDFMWFGLWPMSIG
jgi:hypothetical protein